MKDALDLQKFYPEEISITEVIQNEKEIYIHVSVQSKNCTCPKCGVASEHKHGTYKGSSAIIRVIQPSHTLVLLLKVLCCIFHT